MISEEMLNNEDVKKGISYEYINCKSSGNLNKIQANATCTYRIDDSRIFF